MSQIISPTPGRVVWFYPADHDGIGRLNNQPLAAIVAGVHSDNLVNLAVFDAYGNTQQRSQVHLVQPGEATPDHAHAAWMPYQVKTAGIELPVVDAPAPLSDTPKAVSKKSKAADAEVPNSDSNQEVIGGQQAPTEEAK